MKMSENDETDKLKVKFRHLKVIFAHFREEWYKYVIQATVVISGIVIAFALEKWHLTQLEQEEFTDAYELIAREISVDTTHISTTPNVSKGYGVKNTNSTTFNTNY